MGNIFISHVISDEPLMRELAQGLEQAGYTAWFFERDVLPGPSYLIQITQAMEQCDAVVLLATPAALSSDQVSKEVVGAFERQIPFLPVLVGVTPPELKEKQPEWRHALGGTAMLCADEGISACLPRVLEGLRALGKEPGEREISTTASVPSAPSYISEKILSTRSSLQGERKQVTVLFSDVVGFTPLSEKLDPEEVGDLIRPAVDIMTEEIHRYEGTIAQFLGDGLMALFGAPLAHEDAPHRALYAALAMQRRLAEYREGLKNKGLQFQMRVGVNTGLVIVGRIGDDLTMEYTALGDTVNLASRMESEAKPGMVQVAESTYRLTHGYFDFQDLGEIQVKGKAEPVHAWRVLGALPTRGRVAASISRGLSPFVGRELELDLLPRSYQQAKAGQGQVVGMVGEPGMGKSRLLLQFRELLPEGEYTYLEGGCIHYGDAIAYLPLLGILRNYFDITEGEGETTSKQKMDERLSSLNGQLAHILPPLHELLSLEVDDQAYLILEPAQRRERVFEALRYLLMAESQQRPLILAIEDLHWIDKTSEEFLSSFIDSIPGASVLLLLLYRLEYTPPWTSKSYYSQVRVDHLPEKPSTELVKAILSEGEVAPEISDFIVEKTAGNPLFIEEMTRGMLEAGSILKDNGCYVLSASSSAISVPDTIQGIIASRLDRLSEDLKETLQIASVIGREFSLRLLQEVAGISKPLKSYLLQLQSPEFIYEKSLFPEPEYIFKHALTQEVAYNSLLRKRRKEIHGTIGQAIEKLFPDHLEDFYETLAHHYSRSNENWKAVFFLGFSGIKAMRNYSFLEGVGFYQEAIRLLDSTTETEEVKIAKLDIYLNMIGLLSVLKDSVFDIERLQSEVERLSDELGDRANLAKLYRELAWYHSLRAHISLAMEYTEKFTALAEEIGAVDVIVDGVSATSNARFFSGEMEEVASITRRVLRLLEEQGREKDLYNGALTLYADLSGWNGAALAMMGDFEEAKSVLDIGFKTSLEADDTYGNGWVGLFILLESFLEGQADEIFDHCHRVIDCFRETGIELVSGLAWSLLGGGYLFAGDLHAAKDCAEKAARINEEVGLAVLKPFIDTIFCLTLLPLGQLENARERAEEAVRLSKESQGKTFELFALATLGRIAGEADPAQLDIAEQHILQSISLAEEMHARPIIALGHLFLGEIFEIASRREKALENLLKAEGIYQDTGVPPNSYWLTRTQKALARLETVS